MNDYDYTVKNLDDTKAQMLVKRDNDAKHVELLDEELETLDAMLLVAEWHEAQSAEMRDLLAELSGVGTLPGRLLDAIDELVGEK